MNYYTFSDIFPVRPKHTWASNGHIGGDRGWGGVCDSSGIWAFFGVKCRIRTDQTLGGKSPLLALCIPKLQLTNFLRLKGRIKRFGLR